MTWGVWCQGVWQALHVVPIGDLYEHRTRGTCWCSPRCEGDMLVHHAADRREHTYEQGRTQ